MLHNNMEPPEHGANAQIPSPMVNFLEEPIQVVDDDTAINVTQVAETNGKTPDQPDIGSKIETPTIDSKSPRDDKPPMSYELQQGLRILKEIISDQNKSVNWPFLDPIDTEELWDYTQRIKNPMWLNKMKEKFDHKEYNTVTEFVADMRLMLENCYRYNGPDHAISKRGQKLEIVLEQKLALLSRELREKTTIEATSGKPAEDCGGISYGSRRRAKGLTPHSSSALLNQLRQEERDKEKELRRQHILDRKHQNELYIKELQEWEDKLFDGELHEQMKAMWELPQIGHFLFVANAALNIGEVIQYELECCFLLPRESTTMQKIMTALLSTPYQRLSLDRKPPMPYKMWEEKLRTRLGVWYKNLNKEKTNVPEVADKLGLEPDFFRICGLKNPMRKKKFHELTFYQRVWIMKGLCDFCLNSQDTVRDAIESQLIEDQHAYFLGNDAEGNSYLHFPQFCGADLRIYRQAALPVPSMKPPKKQKPVHNKKGKIESRSPSPQKHSRSATPDMSQKSGRTRQRRQLKSEISTPPLHRPSRLRQHIKTVIKPETPVTSDDESIANQSVNSEAESIPTFFDSSLIKSRDLNLDTASDVSSNASLLVKRSRRGKQKKESHRHIATRRSLRSNLNTEVTEQQMELTTEEKPNGNSEDSINGLCSARSSTIVVNGDKNDNVAQDDQNSPVLENQKDSVSGSNLVESADGVDKFGNLNVKEDENNRKNQTETLMEIDSKSSAGADVSCELISNLEHVNDISDNSENKICSHKRCENFSNNKLYISDQNESNAKNQTTESESSVEKTGETSDVKKDTLKSDGTIQSDHKKLDNMNDNDLLDTGNQSDQETIPADDEDNRGILDGDVKQNEEQKIEEEESDGEEMEEVFPEIGPFELVVTSVETLKELANRFAEQEPKIVKRGKRENIIPPPPRKRCVQDLHNRLLFLLKELEPWEAKLLTANKKGKEKMRKEHEDWIDEEAEKHVEDVWDSDEPVSTESESSDSESEESASESGARDISIYGTEIKHPPRKRKREQVEDGTRVIPEEEITDVSSRGRVRKRRVIPNNVEDQGMKKKSKKPEFCNINPIMSGADDSMKKDGKLSHLGLPSQCISQDGQNILFTRQNRLSANPTVIEALLNRPVQQFQPYQPRVKSDQNVTPTSGAQSQLVQSNQALVQLIQTDQKSKPIIQQVTGTSAQGTPQKIQYFNYSNLAGLPVSVLQRLIQNQSLQLQPVPSAVQVSKDKKTVSQISTNVAFAQAKEMPKTDTKTSVTSNTTIENTGVSPIKKPKLDAADENKTNNSQFVQNAPKLHLTREQLANPAIIQQLMAAGVLKASPKYTQTSQPITLSDEVVQQLLLKSPKPRYAGNITVKSLLETKAAKYRTEEIEIKNATLLSSLNQSPSTGLGSNVLMQVTPDKKVLIPLSTSLQQIGPVSSANSTVMASKFAGIKPVVAQKILFNPQQYVKSSVIDSAVKAVVTESVKTSLPTAAMKVPSPSTLPSLQHRRPVTNTTTAMRKPIPASDFQGFLKSSKPAKTALSSATSGVLTATTHSVSTATNAATTTLDANSSKDTSVSTSQLFAVPPQSLASKNITVSAGSAVPQKNVVLRLVAPGGTTQQGVIMLPRNLVLNPTALQQNPTIQALLSKVQQQGLQGVQGQVIRATRNPANIPVVPMSAIQLSTSQTVNTTVNKIQLSQAVTGKSPNKSIEKQNPSIGLVSTSVITSTMQNKSTSLQTNISKVGSQGIAQNLQPLPVGTVAKSHILGHPLVPSGTPVLPSSLSILGIGQASQENQQQKQGAVICTEGLVSSKPRMVTSVASSQFANVKGDLKMSQGFQMKENNESNILSQNATSQNVIPISPQKTVHIQAAIPASSLTQQHAPSLTLQTSPKAGLQQVVLFNVGGQLVTAQGIPVSVAGGQLKVLGGSIPQRGVQNLPVLQTGLPRVNPVVQSGENRQSQIQGVPSTAVKLVQPAQEGNKKQKIDENSGLKITASLNETVASQTVDEQKRSTTISQSKYMSESNGEIIEKTATKEDITKHVNCI